MFVNRLKYKLDFKRSRRRKDESLMTFEHIFLCFDHLIVIKVASVIYSEEFFFEYSYNIRLYSSEVNN